MMVTSDNTPLSAISTEARTGNPTRTNPAMPIELVGSRPPSIRPTPMNTMTGKKMDPKAPMGSRRKILISSQVSFQSPRNIVYISCAEKGTDRSVHYLDLLRESTSCDGDRVVSPPFNRESNGPSP